MNYSDEYMKAADEFKEKELIDYYVEDLERLAKENNVSLNYYIAEFT